MSEKRIKKFKYDQFQVGEIYCIKTPNHKIHNIFGNKPRDFMLYVGKIFIDDLVVFLNQKHVLDKNNPLCMWEEFYDLKHNIRVFYSIRDFQIGFYGIKI